MSTGTYILDTQELWYFDEESDGFKNGIKLCGYIAIVDIFGGKHKIATEGSEDLEEKDGVAIEILVKDTQKTMIFTFKEEDIAYNVLYVLNFLRDHNLELCEPEDKNYKLLQDYLLLKIRQFKSREKEGEKQDLTNNSLDATENQQRECCKHKAGRSKCCREQHKKHRDEAIKTVGSYVCEECETPFISTRTAEEEQQEFNNLWPSEKIKEGKRVCDDCFKDIMLKFQMMNMNL